MQGVTHVWTLCIQNDRSRPQTTPRYNSTSRKGAVGLVEIPVDLNWC